jgi:hypothetical protein
VVKDICGIKRQIRDDFGTCDFVGNVDFIYEVRFLNSVNLFSFFLADACSDIYTSSCFYHVLLCTHFTDLERNIRSDSS